MKQKEEMPEVPVDGRVSKYMNMITVIYINN